MIAIRSPADLNRSRLPENLHLAVSEVLANIQDAHGETYNPDDDGHIIVIVLHLDNKNGIVCIDRVSTGSLNQCIVHPREVFKGALLSSAAALILVHNHPSGDPEPSREDMDITKRLSEAGKLFDIKVLDHVIVGEGRFISLDERGLL